MSRRTTSLAAILAASAASVIPLNPASASSAACHFGVIKTITAGVHRQAGSVNFNQRSGEIYVAGQGAVEAINSRTYRPSAFIRTGSAPNGIAVNPGTNTVYVANAGSNTLSVINGRTNKVTATIRVVPFPFAVAVDGRNGRIYVAGLTGDISIIKSMTNKVIGTIHLGDNINGAALNQVTGRLYATNDSFPGDPGVIFVVSVRTGRIIARIYPGGKSRPFAIAVNPRTNTVYVTDNPNPGPTGVFVIDGATSQIITKIPTTFYPGYIALNPRNDLVYVLTGTEEDNAVMEIDGRDNMLVDTLPISTLDATFIAVNAPSRYVYVTGQTGELLVLAGCR